LKFTSKISESEFIGKIAESGFIVVGRFFRKNRWIKPFIKISGVVICLQLFPFSMITSNYQIFTFEFISDDWVCGLFTSPIPVIYTHLDLGSVVAVSFFLSRFIMKGLIFHFIIITETFIRDIVVGFGKFYLFLFSFLYPILSGFCLSKLSTYI